ncbi:MAG TPA: lysoplasmalogenase [Hyphomonadaceae bacterium]|jgi:uncharacterized membrane protein YhhN|nr:lysoplasmalogenase [Hyphomonadaceae bacterium]
MTDAAASRTDLARIVFYVGAAIALSHLANEWVKAPTPFGPAWKCAGIVLLGVYVLMRGAWLPALGFFFSAVGDVALELPGGMVPGMAAFGLAHVCYAATFVGYMRREGVMWKAWPLSVVVLAISGELAYWLYPAMAELTVPALAYQVIISAMVVLALMSRAPMIAKIGAVVFMLSDTLIAVGLFRQVVVPPGSVWITYAAAQIMLAIGFTKPRSVQGQAAG